MVFEELERVLMRPKFRRYVPKNAVEVYFTRIERAARTIAGQTPTTERYGPDPKDDYLIYLTLASGAPSSCPETRTCSTWRQTRPAGFRCLSSPRMSS